MNFNPMCYYFDYIIKLEDFDLDNILIDKLSQENIWCKNFANQIRYNRCFVRIYDGTKYLTLFDSENNDAI